MALFGRILVATDFSPASAPAVEEAMRLAASAGAELIIVHAYEPPTPAAFEGYVAPPSVYDQWEQALRSATEEPRAARRKPPANRGSRPVPGCSAEFLIRNNRSGGGETRRPGRRRHARP